jgi:hypothetical protein
MVRNIPPKYSQEMLLEEWANKGTYDILYLPYSHAKQRNSGFAFINFTSEAAALSFHAMWHRRRLAHFSRDKPLSVIAADMQGRDSILESLLQKGLQSTKHIDCQPVIFEMSSGALERITLIEAKRADHHRRAQV